jgi:uncharacterized membrane protein YdbT with pleckstrin-like domain
MSYISDNLMDGEKIEYEAELSNWAFFWQIFFGILLIPVVVGIIILIIYYIQKNSTELAVTNKRVIAKTGFIQRNTNEINLKKVESIQVEQGLLGRMLNYGTIIVSGTGTGHAPIRFISNPLEFRKQISNAQDKLGG